jgi:uncharacterized membrane protein
MDRVFEVVLVLKGLDGLLEIAGGVAFLLVPEVTLNRWLDAVTRHELSEDPHDFLLGHLLPVAERMIGASAVFAGLYLLSHGLVKVVLVGAVFADRLWAYPWMMGFLAVFIVYQAYRFVLLPSVGMAALTVFDAFVLWLTWREYGVRRLDRQTRDVDRAAPDA